MKSVGMDTYINPSLKFAKFASNLIGHGQDKIRLDFVRCNIFIRLSDFFIEH